MHVCAHTHKNSRLSLNLISVTFSPTSSAQRNLPVPCALLSSLIFLLLRKVSAAFLHCQQEEVGSLSILSNLPSLKKGVSCLSTLPTRGGRVSLSIAHSTQAISECLLSWYCCKSIKFYQHRAEFMQKIILPRRVHFLSELLVFLTY